MNKKKINASFTSYKIIDEKNNIIGRRLSDTKLSYDQLIFSCDIGLSTVILRKTKKKNYQFPNLTTKEDYVLWLKITKSNEIFYGLKDCLVYWRKTKNSLSSDFFQKIKDGYSVYYNYLNFGLFKSLLFLNILSINYLKKNLLNFFF